jgi:hypothetical protein
MKTMPKITGNNRISALKRLSKPSPINDPNRRSLIGSKNASIKDARQILLNRNKTSFDARQLLSRQSSKTLDTGSTNLIVRKNLLQNNEEMVVVTGLKDMKMKDGRVNEKFQKEKKTIIVFFSLFQRQRLEVLNWRKRKKFLLLDHLLLLLFVIIIITLVPVRVNQLKKFR